VGGLRITLARDVESKCKVLVAHINSMARRADATGQDLTRFAASVVGYIITNSTGLFDHPKSGGLASNAGIWSRAEGTNGAVMGWKGPAAVYGPVHEFGPRKTAWTIKPGKSIVGPGYSRSGKKTIRLRFTTPAGTFYAKKVRIVWNKSVSGRPHFKPVIKELMPEFLKSLGRRIVEGR
jgi:hypothetical protein